MKRKRKYLNVVLTVISALVWAGVAIQISRQHTSRAGLPSPKQAVYHNEVGNATPKEPTIISYDPFAWAITEKVKVMPQSVRRHAYVSSLRSGLQNPGSKQSAPKINIPITYLGYIRSSGETTAVLKIGEKTELASSASGLNFQIHSLSDDSLCLIDDKGNKSHHRLNIIGSTGAKPGNGEKP